MIAALLAVVCALAAGCDDGPDTPARAPAPAVSAAPGEFVEALPDDVRRAMTGFSWSSSCPTSLDDLRLVHVLFLDFNRDVKPGRIVVHRDAAEATLRVFQRLRQLRFRINRMDLVDDYRGSDELSMANDNTYGFNCQNIAASDKVARHATGRAIDVNPVENPSYRDGVVRPPAGASYLDRTPGRPGMMLAGDSAVQAFAAEGFAWAGIPLNNPDYQHFEKIA